ncbi:MAG: hypothetical protein GY925_25990 [Actinomycetia bacterium]|nr:hypothetical protein [Actinomycetes bacterium]
MLSCGAAPQESELALDHIVAEGSYSSPLADFLALDRSAAGVVERARQREEFIQSCMAMEGFDYVIVVLSVSQIEALGTLPATTPEEEVERIRARGYGISPSLVGDRLGRPDESTPDTFAIQQMSYFSVLSDEEKLAYDQTLYGVGVVDGTDEIGGCAGEARRRADVWDAVTDHFEDKLAGLHARVQADERVLLGLEAWRVCFAQEGYGDLSASQPLEVRAALSRELAAIDLNDVDALARFNDREIEIALADLVCQEQLRKARFAALAEAEQRFIDDNMAALHAFLEQW